MRLLVLLVAAWSATSAAASPVDAELQQFEQMARIYCTESFKELARRDQCVKEQVLGAFRLAMRKSEDSRITDEILMACFQKVGEVHTGGANFVAVGICIDN